MKKLFPILLCLMLLFSTSTFGANEVLSNSVQNLTLKNPPTYLCFPTDGNGPTGVIPSTCTGFGSVLQSTTTFTSLTVTVDRVVTGGGSDDVSVTVEDFTTGNNIASCAITSGKKACTTTFSTSITSGDLLATKVYDNITSNGYNVQKVSWIFQ